MLPLSTSMDHRPREDLLQDCVTLASIKHSDGEPAGPGSACENSAADPPVFSAPPAGCVPGQGEHVHLGLFHDRAALRRMFQAEGWWEEQLSV